MKNNEMPNTPTEHVASDEHLLSGIKSISNRKDTSYKDIGSEH